MKKYQEMSVEELKSLLAELNEEYKGVQSKGLKLDMSRGKPSPVQLDLSDEMLCAVVSGADMKSENGLDCRNYGGLDGIPEAKRLMADLMGTNPENVIIGGSASLNLMYDCIASAMLFGIMGSTPWSKLEKVKFLCPVPGYDRHFKITELMGIEMVNVPMTVDGPDMDMVEKLVSSDSSIKGIWCVPKYSNPQGVVYSDETVKRFANLKPAAKDFRIFWDNAYAVHHLYDDSIKIPDIISECEKAGNPDMVFEFASTSKVSYAGGGISAVAASVANCEWIKKRLNVQTISYDKVNQLRHARFFKDAEGIKKQMEKQAALLRPKFDAVLGILDTIKDLGIGSWVKPLGGYFICFEAMEGCAKSIVAKCKEAGVVLTEAGAPFPYGKDPKDSIIRLSPSYPSPEELQQAAELFVLCVKIVSIEKLLSE